MDERAEAAKKTTLLMIPYGLYILGTKDGDSIDAGTVNFVMQTSFKPPLVAMGVKKDSKLYSQIKASGQFALSFLKSGQKDLAFAYFRPVQVEDDQIGGHSYETHDTGAPVLTEAPAWVEGHVVGEVDVGDHSCVVGEVTNAGVREEAHILTLEECGVKYGG